MPNPHHPKPWHRGSVFGDGYRRPLDREKRARFRYLLNAHHRGGKLTRAARDVGEALLRRLGTDGQCDPCHATLASDAACCDRTVRRATAAMRDLGLLRWQTRLVRAGWRAEQTSNAYELVPTLAAPPVLPRVRCGGQNVRESRKVEIQSSLPLPSPAERQAAIEALARVRAARTALLRLA
ncbi:MAG TPA: hypothetical protein VME47_14760 [Acetobacteraceae bacterium]|nr:hypothetical protein [Acetobacteraceae bacterium]